jgi:hypothetical protein
MKKIFTILSVALISLISFHAKAQNADDNTVKSYIGVIGGASIPLGNYSHGDFFNDAAGMAKNGVTVGLDGAYYFAKNFGIGATFSFQDQGELSATDVQNLSNGYNAAFNKDITTVVAVNRYHNFNLLLGPQYSINSFIFKKLGVDLRLSAGLIKSTSTPSLTVYFDGSTDAATAIHQLSSESKAFAYGGSAGFRYPLGDKWNLTLRGSYVKSDGFTIGNTNNDGEGGRFVSKTPVTEVETTLGISLNL